MMHTEPPMSAEPARAVPTAAVASLSERAAPLPERVLGDAFDELDRMRRFLADHRPASGNEALKLLRAAFPDTPLSVRARAVGDRGAGF